jgi:pilus assembly protein TadC
MTVEAIVALLLALATLVGPGHAVASARLASLTGATAARPGGRSLRTYRLPALAGLATAALLGTVSGPLTGLVLGPLLGLAVGYCVRRLTRRTPDRLRRPGGVDALRLAGGWDLLAACLRGGLPVPAAIGAIAPQLPGEAGCALLRTADLLALGADPAEAWTPTLRHPLTERLARSARRSTRSGAALAGVAEALAAEARSGAQDLAEARAQRAAVAVTGPLGLCFLPAFCCLGVLPVVIGLATRLMSSW